ncbi:MAG: RNA polymerase sigma factor RpoD/SigA [Candidatus Latescibacteria bacterium]|nr:RNA polymerase sigma factor RpoD/SigA [Candidatus Latescibacterota bacterium]
MKIKFGDSKNANNDLSVRSYLRDIRQYKPISRNEEMELFKRVKAGDKTATEKLISSNLRFVVTIANQYVNRGLPLADLIAEGNMGLIHAVAKFDETRTFKFISYAVWWIRQAILKAMAEQITTVRFPVNQIEDLGRIHRTSQTLFQTLGRAPTLAEMAGAANLSLKRAERALGVSQSEVSLDGLMDADEKRSLYNLIAADLPSAEEDLSNRSLAETVSNSVASLTSREAKIVRLYFGLEGEPETLEKIGSQMGVSRERIRQIRNVAMGKLRRKLRVSGLAAA